jgi:hypothetical protein
MEYMIYRTVKNRPETKEYRCGSIVCPWTTERRCAMPFSQVQAAELVSRLSKRSSGYYCYGVESR